MSAHVVCVHDPLISPSLSPQVTNLPGGTYRVRVEFKGDASTFWQYVVTTAVQ